MATVKKTAKKAPAKKSAAKRPAKRAAAPKKARGGDDLDAALDANHPLLNEGNDFQEDEDVDFDGDEIEEDEEVIVAEAPSGAKTRVEPTRRHQKPADFLAEDDGDDEDEAERAPRATKEQFNALRKALDVAEAASSAEVERAARSDAKRTKRDLAKAPTTRWLVQLDPGERPGATISVTINGHRLSIRKGVLVELPVPVAEILAAHYNVESEAMMRASANASDEALDA